MSLLEAPPSKAQLSFFREGATTSGSNARKKKRKKVERKTSVRPTRGCCSFYLHRKLLTLCAFCIDLCRLQHRSLAVFDRAAMLARISVFGLLVLKAASAAADRSQLVFQSTDPANVPERPLYGRFLHFTDIHPDKFYTPGTSVNDACHGKSKAALQEGQMTMTSTDYDDTTTTKKKKKKKKERKNRAGFWGTGIRLGMAQIQRLVAC